MSVNGARGAELPLHVSSDPQELRLDASVQLLLAEFGVNLREDQIHQPPMMSSTYANDYHEFKNGRLKQDEALRQRIRENNRFDIGLYEWALPRFCTQLKLRSLQTHDTYRICK